MPKLKRPPKRKHFSQSMLLTDDFIRPDDAPADDYKELEAYYTNPLWGKKIVGWYYRPGMSVLEPTAGDGSGFAQFVGRNDLTTVELNAIQAEKCSRWTDDWYNGNIMDWKHPKGKKFDLVIGNLPYSMSRRIVQRLYHFLNPGALVVLVDKLAFDNVFDAYKRLFASKYREIRKINVPRKIIVEVGGTGLMDLAIFVLGRKADYINYVWPGPEWWFDHNKEPER